MEEKHLSLILNFIENYLDKEVFFISEKINNLFFDHN